MLFLHNLFLFLETGYHCAITAVSFLYRPIHTHTFTLRTRVGGVFMAGRSSKGCQKLHWEILFAHHLGDC